MKSCSVTGAFAGLPLALQAVLCRVPRRRLSVREAAAGAGPLGITTCGICLGEQGLVFGVTQPRANPASRETVGLSVCAPGGALIRLQCC